MIRQAQARIELLSQQIDGDDAKSLGFIAADLAAIGLILLLRSDLHGLWWVAAIGFLLSVSLLVGAAWPREFGLGPDLAEFYQEWGGGRALQANEKLLAVLFRTIEKDETVIRVKEPWAHWGRLALAPTLVITILLFVLRVGPGH